MRQIVLLSLFLDLLLTVSVRSTSSKDLNKEYLIACSRPIYKAKLKFRSKSSGTYTLNSASHELSTTLTSSTDQHNIGWNDLSAPSGDASLQTTSALSTNFASNYRHSHSNSARELEQRINQYSSRCFEFDEALCRLEVLMLYHIYLTVDQVHLMRNFALLE